MSKIGTRAMMLLSALPIAINVMTQEVKTLTLEDLIPGGETYRYAENLYGLQWWGTSVSNRAWIRSMLLSRKREKKRCS